RSTSSWSPAWFPNEYLEILFSVQVPLSTLRWSPDGSVRRAGAACERHRQSREVCRELCHPLRRWYPPPERNHSDGRGTQLRLFRKPCVRRNRAEALLAARSPEYQLARRRRQCLRCTATPDAEETRKRAPACG